MKKGKITDWLIKSNVIQAEDRDLYDYACRSLVFLFAPFVIALVAGMVFRMVAEALLMAVPYVVLRSFCGGFHLKSIKLCLVVSTLSYLANITVTKASRKYDITITSIITLSLIVNYPKNY